MKRLIIFLLSLFPYVKSLKAENESLESYSKELSEMAASYERAYESLKAEIKSLKAENGNLVEALHLRVTELRSLSRRVDWGEIREIESLKAEVMYLKAGLKKCHGRMLKAQRKAAKLRQHPALWHFGVRICDNMAFPKGKELSEN